MSMSRRVSWVIKAVLAIQWKISVVQRTRRQHYNQSHVILTRKVFNYRLSLYDHPATWFVADFQQIVMDWIRAYAWRLPLLIDLLVYIRKTSTNEALVFRTASCSDNIFTWCSTFGIILLHYLVFRVWVRHDNCLQNVYKRSESTLFICSWLIWIGSFM